MEGSSVSIQKFVRLILTAGVVIGLTAGHADAQFGRNKVQYDKFKFQVLATQHFDIYYYPTEATAVAEAGRMAERWYGRLSHLFGHELSSKQSVILYASHPDFEQTNVVEGELDEGTGGVTESARRRVLTCRWPRRSPIRITCSGTSSSCVSVRHSRPQRRRPAALVHRGHGG